MTTWKFVLAVAAVLAAGWITLDAAGAWRWESRTRALLAQLEGTRQPHATARYHAGELEGLPAPVQRYFRAALRDGQSMIAAVSLEHAGQFDTGEDAARWKPFTSRQRVVTRRPGFVWDARVAMLPGLPVRVHDAYVAGTGRLQPSLLGLFSLAELAGTPEMARDEFMRFFAEAAWYPTALLPSQGVRWEPVDERSARATMSDGSVAVTLTFRFGADDTIESVRAEARGRTAGGTTVPTPWEGRWSDPQTRDGMRVPMRGEVAWLTPEGPRPYWRGRITSLRYEFAP